MVKNTHGTRSDLIHCDNCGEDYSSTYKRCPFCGARPANTQSAGGRMGGGSRVAPNYSRSSQPVEEDDYVFDGQDVFDDLDRERGGSPYRGGGGRHLSGGPLDISPTTLIGFVVSGVIVIAAILIVLFVVIPMIRGGQVETATKDPNGSLPVTASQSQPVSPSQLPTISPSPTVDPSADPAASPSPSAPASPSPSSTVPPVTGGLTITDSRGSAKEDITISDKWPSPVQLKVSGASGSVTWASTDTSVATVSADGLVTAVNKGTAYITATDGAGKSQKCMVRSTITLTATAPSPSQSQSPAPSQSQSPAPSASQSPAPSQSQSPAPSGGTLTFSAFGNTLDDFTMNAANPNPVTLKVTGASGTVTWSSSNNSVATVNANGTVSMVGKGQCTITATDASGNTGTCLVRVN